jgi:transcriptional regulator with GAF, ATPase, and Fis domain
MTKLLSSVPNVSDRILVLAALFEGDFSIDWVVNLTEEKVSQILAALEEGTRKGFLTKKGMGIYYFVDSNKKKKLQDHLNSDEKVRLYQQIADLLIKELPDDDNKPQYLANHLLHISNNLENCRWLIKAGDNYLKIFDTENALNCYTKALNDLSCLNGEEADSLFAETAVSYSKISPARHDITTVLSVINEAIFRAKRSGIKTSQALLNLHLAKNEWYCSQYHAAWEHFEEGWFIVKDLNNYKLFRSATTLSTFFLFWQGCFREAVHTYEKSVSDVERFPQGRFPLLASVTVGSCYAHIGLVSQGLGMLDAIQTYCQEKGDIYMKAYAGAAIGNTMLDIGRISDAIQYLECSVAEAILTHNDWVNIMSRLMLAFAYHLIGNNDRSITKLREFLRHSNEVHMTVRAFPYLMDLYWAMEQGKLQHIPGLSLENEVNQMISGENIFMKGVAYRYQALLQRQENLPHEKILQSLNLSLKWLDECGDKVELARSQFELSREYLSNGEEEKAKETMMMALKTLSPLGGFSEGMVPDDLKYLVNEPLSGETLLKEILKLGQEVVTIRDNKELVQHIISTGNRITGAERGTIFLLEGDTSSPTPLLRASKNITSEQVSCPSFASSMEMVKEVALMGKGRILGISSAQNPGFHTSEIIRSRICVPMILRDKVVGVLYHDNRLLSSAFRESDLELLAYFAALAAFAMDNARAYEEIQRLNQKLEEEKLYYEEQHLQNLHFEDIIGKSPTIKRVLAQMDQVAMTDTTALILGETGVGKELVATGIHRNSSRNNKPFIRVHCSSLPENLISSELFGHEKGAFTGAIQRRIGRFELANGGTLFLDEIGDLPLEVQVRLLRVLQSREFERVGGSETLRSDFRLIVATNRDLEQLVKENRFRSDLYYRLNVFPIHVPSLRERKEDIPLLANHFLKVYSTKMGKTIKMISEAEINKLMRYDWPGNIRELEHIIERSTVLSPGPYLHIPELSIQLPESTNLGVDIPLKDKERQYILQVLEKTGWKVRGLGGAAEILKIHPSTLISRMKKLGIQRPEAVSKRRTPTLRTQDLIAPT